MLQMLSYRYETIHIISLPQAFFVRIKTVPVYHEFLLMFEEHSLHIPWHFFIDMQANNCSDRL